MLSILAILAACASATSPLPSNLPIDPTQVSTGGLSAGAFFAVQYGIAWSESIMGISVLAGGPYNCAGNSEIKAITACMQPNIAYPVPSAQDLINGAKIDADLGLIDGLGNLSSTPVWLYSGMHDTVVDPSVVNVAAEFFQTLGSKVTFEKSIPSEHCFPTLSYGNACGNLGSPFINRCGYDAAGISLAAIYGTGLVNGTANPSNLLTFDQTPFGGGQYSLADYGYLYVPTACKQGGSTKCKLHVHFHGCQQGPDSIGDTYARYTGLLPWAEGSNIIVLFPQVVKDILGGNPEGCFNWWGYSSDSNYAYKTGIQMSAVRKMQEQLQSP